MMSMSKYKTFICFAIIFCTVICFLSCSKNKSDIDDIFSQLIISDSSESDGVAFAEHIYVIIPNGCSGELSLKARELVEAINDITGILTSLKYDNELYIEEEWKIYFNCNFSCHFKVGKNNKFHITYETKDLLYII